MQNFMKSDYFTFQGKKPLVKKALFLLGLLLVSVAQTLSAQNTFTYSGLVKAENGDALPGVNVVEKGTVNGTITDFDGAFQITTTKASSTFTFSMVGYETIESTIKPGVKAAIVMKESVVGLGEVLVVGYGVQKRSNITGAISKMDNKTISQLPTNNVNQALQGRIAGVNALNTSGSPGAATKLVIRGVGSNGKSQPLYVIDGIVSGNIDNVEPADIEAITVLKDAASAAIYGAEGANGVVLVTTKSGAKGTSKVEYNMQFGSQSIGNYTKPMDASSYATWVNEANVGVTIPTNSDVNTKWMEEILDNAMMQRHHLSFSGGTDKGNYYVSGGYLKQGGVIGGEKSNYERFTLHSNITQQVKSWVKIGSNLNYSHFKRNAINENDEFSGIVASGLMLDPLTPVTYNGALPGFVQDALNAGRTLVTDPNGLYYGLSPYVKGEIANPLAQMAIAKGGTTEDKFTGNVFMTLGDESWKGFKFTTRASADVANQLYHTWYPTFWFSSERMNTQANTRDNTDTWFTWMFENYLSYEKTFAGKHNVSGVVGVSAKQYTYKYIKTFSGPIFTEDDDFAQHGEVEIDGKVSGNLRDDHSSSYFARAAYDYDGKYLFSAIFRRDATSLLHSNNRWGNFPSVSAGWIVSSEDFWKSDLINFFKIRASWGKNGSLSNLEPDQFRSLIVASGIQYPKPGGGFYTGAEPELLANPELKWETSQQLDLGFDMNLLNDRFSVGFDFFNKVTKDLLVPGTPPPSVGNYAPFVNAGDITNKGVELELTYRNYDHALRYDISANATWMKNEVTYLNPLLDRVSGETIGTGWTATYLELNQPVWYFRGYQTDGIFQNQAEIDAYKAANGGLAGYNPVPGDPIVVNSNGDNLINNEDQTYIGNPHPKFMWGANLNLAYANFDMRIFLQGVHGQDILMAWNRYDRSTSNRPQFFFDERWIGEGSTNERPRADQSSPYIYNSDLMIFKGSYVRVRQIQVGYTLPGKITNNTLQNLRVSLSLDDYFTFTKYPGMDPSASTADDAGLGIDRGYYPSPRKIMLGLSVSL